MHCPIELVENYIGNFRFHKWSQVRYHQVFEPPWNFSNGRGSEEVTVMFLLK